MWYVVTTLSSTQICLDFAASGSILIQNNVNTPNAFIRLWLDFKNGFGDTNGNYWLGNDAIHNYLAGHQYQLYVYVYPVSAVYPYLAIYQYYFSVGDSTSNYLIGLGMSGGNAASNGMGAMSNSQFSTSDMDNDSDPQNCCATTYGAGWWYGGNPLSNGYQCGTTMLNGWGNNFVWAQDTTLTLRASQMWLVYWFNKKYFNSELNGEIRFAKIIWLNVLSLYMTRTICALSRERVVDLMSCIWLFIWRIDQLYKDHAANFIPSSVYALKEL